MFCIKQTIKTVKFLNSQIFLQINNNQKEALGKIKSKDFLENQLTVFNIKNQNERFFKFKLKI